MKTRFAFLLTCLLAILPLLARANDVDALKQAEDARLAGQFEKSLQAANTVKSPVLHFWQTVLQAEAYLELAQPQNTLALLRNLEQEPWPEAAGAPDGYAWLYKRALLARQSAKILSNQSTDFEDSQLAALYPRDDTALSNAPLSFSQKIAKLKRLALAASYKNVRGLLTTSEIEKSELSAAEKCDAFLLLGRSLKSFREETSTAQSALQKVARSASCDRESQAKALFYLGSIGKLTADDSLRVQSYQSLAENYPGHSLSDDALFELSQYYEERDPVLAAKYLKKLDEQKTGDIRLDYFFEKGFAAFKEKKFSEAAHQFAKMAETTTPINESYVKGLYWQARTLESLKSGKKSQEAKSAYQNIIKNYPFSFYAVLAAKRLNTTVAIPAFAALNGTPPDVADAELEWVNAFNQSGYSQGARVVLDLILIAHPELKKTHEEFLAQKCIESENYKAAIEMAAAHFGSGVYGPVTHEKDPLFAAFYPQAYRQQIQKGYRISGLPLGAIEGIAREESLFEKEATSWVGAKGLMQLMPATARMIQGAVSEHSSTNALTDALNNVLLGSHYLHLMQQKFSNEMPLAIMAYNAGPGNVSKWLKRSGGKDLDVFIEDIPLSETKGYVKRVMRSMNVYGALYNEDFFKKNQFSMNIR